jgi:polar amino acid transport system substrate-binding protein
MGQETGTVQLVADPYPPYQYGEGEDIRGVDQDIIVAAFKEHGMNIVTRLLPWDDCLQFLKEGKAHGIFQITLTCEREKAYIFSKPLRVAKTVFYKRAEKPLSFVESVDILGQLKKYRVGVVRGYSYSPLIDGLGVPSRIEADSQETLLTGLSRGDFDLIVMDWGVAEYMTQKWAIGNIEKVSGYESTRQLHVAFHPSRQEIADRFNSGLDRVKEKGLFDRVFERYGLTPFA